MWDPYPTLTTLAECVCAALADSEGGPTCFCGIVPGEAAVQDYVGDDCGAACGMAWVRLTTAYPAVGVGQPIQRLGNCASSLGYEVEIGVMRCISAGDEAGNAPSPEELLAATKEQMSDMAAVVRAVSCCDGISGKDFILGTYTPLGPEGGVVGGVWTVQMIL